MTNLHKEFKAMQTRLALVWFFAFNPISYKSSPKNFHKLSITSCLSPDIKNVHNLCLSQVFIEAHLFLKTIMGNKSNFSKKTITL